MVDSNIITMEKIESIIYEVNHKHFDETKNTMEAILFTNKRNICLIEDKICWDSQGVSGAITMDGVGQVKIQVISDLEYTAKIFFYPKQEESLFMHPTK